MKAQRDRIHEFEREEEENDKVRQELETKEMIARTEIRDLRLEKAQMLENENKVRHQRLEAEIHADSHLNHTLKVCTYTRFSAEEAYTCLSGLAAPVFLPLPESNCGGKVGTRTPPGC